MYRKVKGTLLIDAKNPEKAEAGIKKAAETLRRGGLVAFPTETVYGLGASAFSGEGVKKIFRAKGRPPDNPLIVHLAQLDTLKDLAVNIPPQAWTLAARFWPGPLTLILPKSPRVPPEVTAGLDTVAVRMPLHPTALALLRQAGLPLAAPSANLSGRPSPTTVEHVVEDLAGRVEIILDGGPCLVGLESTVLDITGKKPVLLRPGAVTLEELQEVLGEVEVPPDLSYKDRAAPSPGLKYRHYAPRAPMFLVEGTREEMVGKMKKICQERRARGQKVGLLLSRENRELFDGEVVEDLGPRNHPGEMAARLFYALRRLDSLGVDYILAETYEEKGIGLALMNRLRKAASGRVIKAPSTR
ncbi:MAG: threonylcarbamoyl-AMP synthase [Candidatus Syntrophonatronum acetioxidans]|uniref:Threonylcarbamoyl-AMP synthase n=1 Tax=Candidatus Syntrophonatronum acetioxidans TaxID=1795816 RepID=A0A424YFY9_9FIRM|nr:MAG: threonylcarbamoyl-AMP synthase [Candidatus Syntrophonatronum acetioxidans]